MTSPAPRPAAVLWDFDGTLVDSHGHWTAAWAEMATRRGGTWTDADTESLVGLDLTDAARAIRDHLGVDDSPQLLVSEMVDGVAERIRVEVPWRAGARALLEAVHAEGIPCALVTMSYRTLVEPMLERVPPGTFGAVVTGDAVAHGKPHPEPYLAAAAALGVRPERCVAIEDSRTGVASARAAGCAVLVTDGHGAAEAGTGDVVVDGLEGVTVADLRKMVTG
ncbi:HAD family hydrolase [Nocardioides sp. GXZ039]|uniref:HAD family hydrolase n=1 Tax=Nocardioides sp. GXZ039 TaxID=3136018 RepID=UPI0030F45FA3